MRTVKSFWNGLGVALLGATVPWVCAAVGDEELDRRIAPGDILIIEVFGEKDLSVERRVEAGGKISYPYLRIFDVGGKTTSQVEGVLKEKLEEKYLVDAQVTVNVKEFRSRTVSVLGQVVKGGAIKLPAEQPMDIVEAIAEAGGFTNLAKEDRIEHTRKGETKKYKFNELRKVTDSKKKIWLEPGDVIYVPEKFF